MTEMFEKTQTAKVVVASFFSMKEKHDLNGLTALLASPDSSDDAAEKWLSSFDAKR